MAAVSDKLAKILVGRREFGRFINEIVQKSSRKSRHNIFRARDCKLEKNWIKASSPKTVFSVAFPTVGAIGFGFGSSKKASPPVSVKEKSTMSVITEAERLYDEGDQIKLYEYLIQHKDVEDADVQWRLARATCDMAKELGKKDKNKRKVHVYEAFEYAKKALALNEENFACNKWYAILLDYTGEYEGIKSRISNAYTVKKHFIKAIELNPRDSTSMYSLGYWCFAFADLAWYERKIAGALFASPPNSSYEEALEYFKKAEEVDPGFYSMNLVMLGKTLIKLKNPDQAKPYLQQAVDYPVKTADDEQAHKEATDLLKKL